MHRSTLLIAALIAATASSPVAALADSVIIPKIVRPTPGGDYVLRAEIVTSQSVAGLEYQAHYVTPDGRVGEEIEGTTTRPGTLNTRAGNKHRGLVVIPGAAIKSEQMLALCIWKEPPAPSGTQSQLLSAFRYCKLFTAKP